MAKKDIVLIGGSTGSGAVLKQILRDFPEDLPASVFVTMHLPAAVHSMHAEMLQAASRMQVGWAVDGQPIEPGRVYLAPPDRHLLLIDGAVRLGVGPRENMVRPAIDPMFRSGAMSYGARAVGVVLTGMMSDGAAGLSAIKQRGGTAVVQHPRDAQADEMPRAALGATDVDHVCAAGDIAGRLCAIVEEAAGDEAPVSDDLLFEVEIAAGAPLGSEGLRSFAEPVALTCPDCGGVLSEVKGARPLRFRCQIGHAYTADILASRHEQVDEAIRVAMRVMEERVELVERMSRDARQTGRMTVAELYESRAEEYRRYARTLREAAILSLRMGRAGGEQSV